MRYLFENLSSILISLVLAVLVWVAAVRQQNPPREADYNQVIPIEITPPASQLLVADPLPETVQLRLVAPESSWADLTVSKFKASLDLSQLGEGFNDVPVKVEVSDRLVEIVEQKPGVATVKLEALQTVTLPVEVSLMDGPPLGYVNRSPTVDPATVVVTGPASVLDQADKAVASLFIGSSKETIQTSRNLLIHTRDGQLHKNLTVTPAKVQIMLPIEQRFGYKDVSVRVQVQGQVAPGYRVSNISVNPPTLTLVGKPGGLAAIKGFIETMPVNLNQATESIVRTVPLDLPDGVTVVLSEGNNGPGGVEVAVEITPIEDGITLQRPVNQQGIDPDFWWRASPDRTDVFLSGPLTQLQALQASDINVIVDLFGLEPGTYKLQPTVFYPDGLRIDTILPDIIEVTIGRKIARPVTQSDLSPDYSWMATPDQVDLLLAGSVTGLQDVITDTLNVVVNLSELEPGLYRIKPLVTLPDTVTLDSIVPGTIDVVIQAKPLLTTTLVITKSDTISITSTPLPEENGISESR